jgi:hypothetical protein
MNILLKIYNQLSTENQHEVNDFLDFMLSKNDNKNSFDMTRWKAKILDVSVWTKKDMQVFDDNRKYFKQWKTEDW